MFELLYDEKLEQISEKNINERHALINYMKNLPIEFFSKLRHLQPQIGCLNCCTVCSRDTSSRCEYWTENQLRNVVSAIKTVAKQYRSQPPYLAWDRQGHRKGQIFAYRDNDLGSYPYFDLFLRLASRDLGVKMKISTVGFSRHNTLLNEVHRKVNEEDAMNGILSVRLSFTPFAIGWNNNERFSKSEYEDDIANFLTIYRPIFEKSLKDQLRFHVALRFKAFVRSAQLIEQVVQGKRVIICGNYVFIGNDDSDFETCTVNPDLIAPDKQSNDFNLNLTLKTMKVYANPEVIVGKGIQFKKYILADNLKNNISPESIINMSLIGERGLTFISDSLIYRFENREGYYYAVDPLLTEKGYYAMEMYPALASRNNKSGFLDSEKLFFNAINQYKSKVAFDLFSLWEKATYDDVENVIDSIYKKALYYKQIGYSEYADFIINDILDTVKMYAAALKKANYPASMFFDGRRTVDTGIVSNIGRAHIEYAAVTSLQNEPITPFQTRNFGNLSSVKTQENDVWDLCCSFGNKVSFCLPPPPSDQPDPGDNRFNYELPMFNSSVYQTLGVLATDYLVPGQRKRS